MMWILHLITRVVGLQKALINDAMIYYGNFGKNLIEKVQEQNCLPLDKLKRQ